MSSSWVRRCPPTRDNVWFMIATAWSQWFLYTIKHVAGSVTCFMGSTVDLPPVGGSSNCISYAQSCGFILQNEDRLLSSYSVAASCITTSCVMDSSLVRPRSNLKTKNIHYSGPPLIRPPSPTPPAYTAAFAVHESLCNWPLARGHPPDAASGHILVTPKWSPRERPPAGCRVKIK